MVLLNWPFSVEMLNKDTHFDRDYALKKRPTYSIHFNHVSELGKQAVINNGKRLKQQLLKQES